MSHEDDTIREMCRRVLREWVDAWPDPQKWKHEARWQEDGVAIMAQNITDDRVWSVTAFFPRTHLELGSGNTVRWQALQSWRELHTAAQQQGDVS